MVQYAEDICKVGWYQDHPTVSSEEPQGRIPHREPIFDRCQLSGGLNVILYNIF